MTPRVVIDTNVVLSALLFTDGRLAWMRHAWQRQQMQPLVCKETASELLRILACPKFKLTGREQQELLADFLPHAEVVELPTHRPELPACRDKHDDVFLLLAHVAKADALVTGDADILAMRDAFPGLIVTPDQLAERMGTITGSIFAAAQLVRRGGHGNLVQPAGHQHPERRR